MVQTIDTAPDPLHGDITPSVVLLIELGLEGARAVVPVLNAPGLMTRQRAFRVVQGAVGRHFGFREGKGFPSTESAEAWRRVLEDNAYRAEAPERERAEAAERWRRWLATQGGAK